MAITFARIKEYLGAVAAAGNLDAATSGHGLFWETDYASFMAGVVPTKNCNGSPVPIINRANMAESAFFRILQGDWCATPKMRQMPRTGPFVTDPGYTIRLPDGTDVTGAQLLSDIHEWLLAGAPEDGEEAKGAFTNRPKM